MSVCSGHLLAQPDKEAFTLSESKREIFCGSLPVVDMNSTLNYPRPHPKAMSLLMSLNAA